MKGWTMNRIYQITNSVNLWQSLIYSNHSLQYSKSHLIKLSIPTAANYI